MNKILFIIASIFILNTASSAFDGDRKGLAIGAGVGYYPYISWNIKNSKLSETLDLRLINVKIGYSWNENNLLALDIFLTPNYTSDELSNYSVVFDTRGIRWFHYFNNYRYKPYLSVGAIRLLFNTHYFDEKSIGYGMIVGTGFEFIKHFQFGVSYMYGKSSNEIFDNHHRMLSFTLTALAY